MINTIFLFGNSGMLGRYIYSYFTDNPKITIKTIDFRITKDISIEKLEDVLIKNGMTENVCIINCIGLIPQRENNNKRDYYLINSIFPNILWSICKKYNSQMIQPTTDCVFSGIKGNYIETDEYDENTDYGLSKSLGEPCEATIIRTSIIGREINNKYSFMEWVIHSITNNQQITGWENHLWNGITCLEYCKIIEKIINNNLFWKGVRHIYSPTSKSKYEIANIINNVFFTEPIEIIKGRDIKNIDKTLKSIYENIFDIPELEIQIAELKDFELYKI
jgi:dTDP-4-dehydrorhamnose reductase